MLRVTKLTDYGVLLLSQMADGDEREACTARDLADSTRLPLPMVSKIAKLLAHHGLLLSHRGAKGGYSLARPAHKITLAEIIAALEGPIAITDCLGHDDCRCEADPICSMRGNWDVVNHAVRGALEGVTLEDMVAGKKVTVPSFPLALASSGSERSGK
ncbi:MAG: SUF system Fe-S cluster assembly regulator [Candidatus Sumerlaeota bacterium]|nr:SUF system Fe-S cluster assembly regulator [Candidatus Sumerlaeota bacterium]